MIPVRNVVTVLIPGMRVITTRDMKDIKKGVIGTVKQIRPCYHYGNCSDAYDKEICPGWVSVDFENSVSTELTCFGYRDQYGLGVL